MSNTKKKPTKKTKLKKFNVFYTLIESEYEVVVEAKSALDAANKVDKLLTELNIPIDEVRAGWEVW